MLDCVVLGGGGYSFPAHLGALRALEDAGLIPKRYAGTSCGANVAALRVAGFRPEELHEVQKKTRLERYRPSFALNGLFQVGGMLEVEGLLKARTGKARPTFEDVSELTGCELSVSTYCLTSGSIRRFSTSTDPGRGLVDVLRASCLVPLWNPPVEIDESAYLDGGVLELLPMLDHGEPGRTLGLDLTPDVVGGSDVGAIFDKITQHLNDANERAYSERGYAGSVVRLLKGADLPNRGSERADELFRVGFDRTKEYLLRKAEAAMRGDEAADQHAP
jgi:predicted acylesterase/phospholipase RssA